ncbi:MAG TPA: cellulose binding domain-containing protein [Actinocrinis sp.]|jgi:chitinase|uniref:cellulose binding domain-containing protein n=1 Tax=Actinocrinis sp. TaxID=1920516 RepID=UPI002D402C80|nr:cellulose binding domain-containing protein [Actinocrinis sp.]HZU57176.1 cellulose binding domain-containing protein [Actinocrinis sp.]
MRKRGAALAAGSLLLGLGLVPMTAATSAAATLSCTATATYSAAWNNGFVFEVLVTNTGTESFNTWVVTFDMPPGYVVDSVWNGQETQTGQHVIVRGGGPGYNIAPGSSVLAFGGIAQGVPEGGFTNITCTPGVVL